MLPRSSQLMGQIVALAKRRGFIYPSAEIYGGAAALWDFGPYGVLTKDNIKRLWWERFVRQRDDVVGVESPVLTKREVLVASGHEDEFVDPLIECKKCHSRFRTDQLLAFSNNPPAVDQDRSGVRTRGNNHKIVYRQCPSCGGTDYTEPRQFNLMFKTHLGPTEDSSSIAYLRPETAQGMFTNFKTILETTRKRLPFGIAQIGKSFRNEITTGNFIFRSREFEIAEIEYFVKPEEDQKWFERWVGEWEQFFGDLGLKKEKLRRYEHPKESLAHYSKGTTDFEYEFPFGWSELAGVANRTDYDLAQHERHSGQDLKYFDEERKEKYWPYVVEPTLGVERLMLALLVDSFDTIKSQDPKSKIQVNTKIQSPKNQTDNQEYVLRLHPKIAPITAAVFPLINKDKLPDMAREIYQELKKHWFVEYDDSGSIGRRYRRQDEIGTPWCITVDFETLKDETVTIRDRDTMKQKRLNTRQLVDYLSHALSNFNR